MDGGEYERVADGPCCAGLGIGGSLAHTGGWSFRRRFIGGKASVSGRVL